MNCPLCGAEVDERYLCADLECAGSTEAFQLAYDAEGVAYLERADIKPEAQKFVERWIKNWRKRLDEILINDTVACKFFDAPEVAEDVRAALAEIDKLEREVTKFEVAFNARNADYIEFKKTATEDMRAMQERAEKAEAALQAVSGAQRMAERCVEEAEAERDRLKAVIDRLEKIAKSLCYIAYNIPHWAATVLEVRGGHDDMVNRLKEHAQNAAKLKVLLENPQTEMDD